MCLNPKQVKLFIIIFSNLIQSMSNEINRTRTESYLYTIKNKMDNLSVICCVRQTGEYRRLLAWNLSDTEDGDRLLVTSTSMVANRGGYRASSARYGSARYSSLL
jgi:hypothetical protein